MEKTRKITKRDNFNKLLTIEEVANDTQLVDFIKNELMLLDKKSASHGAVQSANQKANEGIKEVLIEELVKMGKSTITDLQKANEELSQYSNQKLSALITQLIKSDKVERVKDGKKSYFKVVE